MVADAADLQERRFLFACFYGLNCLCSNVFSLFATKDR
jgi:hypothetical protein